MLASMREQGARIIQLRQPRIISRLRLTKKDISAADRALLADIRAVFEQRKGDAMHMGALLARLPEPAPTQSALETTLSKLNIGVIPVRVGNVTAAGYRLADFDRVWRRYSIKASATKPAEAISPAAAAAKAVVPVREPLPRVQANRGTDWVQFWTVSVALLLAAIAAYFSVSGMTRIFPGAVAAVVMMASVMEAAKLAGAAWLSRYWRSTSILIKAVLICLLLILALVNAAGVYGQLSAAHLDPHVEAATSSDLQMTEARARLDAQESLLRSINDRIALIDATVKSASDRGRASTAVDLASSQAKERTALIAQRTHIETDIIPNLRVEVSRANGVQQKAAADIGIMEYAAATLGVGREQMIQWLILMMVLTCDPLSITLVIATASRRRMRAV